MPLPWNTTEIRTPAISTYHKGLLSPPQIHIFKHNNKILSTRTIQKYLMIRQHHCSNCSTYIQYDPKDNTRHPQKTLQMRQTTLQYQFLFRMLYLHYLLPKLVVFLQLQPHSLSRVQHSTMGTPRTKQFSAEKYVYRDFNKLLNCRTKEKSCF